MRLLAIIFIVGSLVGCGRTPYPEYREIGENTHMKLIALGDGDRTPEDGDVLSIWLGVNKFYEAPGVLFYDSYEYSLEGDGRSSGFETCLKMMQEGDSATFTLPFSELGLAGIVSEPSNISDTTMIGLQVGLQKIRTAAEHEAERRAFKRWLNDQDLTERKSLLRYIKAQGMDPKEHYVSGIYYLEDLPGSGRRVQNGDLISIKYRGRFLDSTLFDSSYRSQQPLVFRLGDPAQVVAGMEIGIRQMRVGGLATFIIPSQLGFGHIGSSTGIIPPFTTIIYEVQLDEIIGSKARPE